MRDLLEFLGVAKELELAGLAWMPEIGDEVSSRKDNSLISVLVDPDGMTPGELRNQYIWLPTVEQMVLQFEARQAILFHAGLELSPLSLCYKTVIRATHGVIESEAESFRASVGQALRDLLLFQSDTQTIN
jgi:hypothetical protein